MRIGGPGKQGRAIKVWEKREFKDLDDSRELGTRNIKIALRRLRRFAPEIAQGRILLLVDLPMRRVAEIEQRLRVMHPEARLENVDAGLS